MKEWNVFSVSEEKYGEDTKDKLTKLLNNLERDKWYIQSIKIGRTEKINFYIFAWKELIAADAEELSCINANAPVININAPIINRAHKDMERFCEESLFRIKCPMCKKGLLLVGRSQRTQELLEYDNCVMCGQRVRYTDIKDLQNFDHGRLDKLPEGWKEKYRIKD